ncbi:MAG: sulfurtransferase [Planctomycetota bacterium]|jgi:RluA family pseudouridine synthase
MNRIVNIAAYKFAVLDRLQQRRREWLALCDRLVLKGTILLSEEGINMFIAGSRDAVDQLLAEVRLVPALSDLEVKESYGDYQPFSRMLIKIKKEIIAFGVESVDPRQRTSRRVSPVELKSWLDRGEPVALLDVRNDFEYDVGTFHDAIRIGIDDFRDFPAAIDALPEELRNRKIVTFCTAGIRCEKAAPLMEQQGFTDVLQLDGGILKYFEECGGDHYDGECFVFDKRVALDSALHETEMAQCYACQATLTVEQQQAPEYVPGRSCPFCYQSSAQKWKRVAERRSARVAAITNPAPGCLPYDNVRPVYVAGRFDGLGIMEFLSAIHTHFTLDQWRAALVAGEVTRKGRRLSQIDTVRAGDRLDHLMPDTIEPDVNVEIRIIHEDESIAVIDKPAPLPMHPCGRFNRNSLSWILAQVYEPVRLRCVHRLDANTSGIVVFGKTRNVAAALHRQFQQGSVEKQYIAKVNGRPVETEFACDVSLAREPGDGGIRLPDPDGLAARTEFRVTGQRGDESSIVSCMPITGRTNQIRIHLWKLGHPIAGDPTYLPGGRLGEMQAVAPQDAPLCLHASRISFAHPKTGESIVFESELPEWVGH